jgi:DNA mismatch repair ATPase MutL
MSRIRILAENVANKIAAGEVVERRANAGVAELKLRLPENRT